MGGPAPDIACRYDKCRDCLAADAMDRYREALNWIRGFAESLEERHTGFTHIRRRVDAALEVAP